MISLGELRVKAVRENLRTISYFIHGIARRLELTEDTLFEIELAVEEAAINVVSHAYPSGRAGDLLICVEVVENDVVQITLKDWGAPLDPARVKPFDINAPVETRIQGGMGLHLIQSVTNSVVRQAATAPGEPNSLILTKKISRLEAGARRPSSLRELRAMRTVSEVMASSTDLGELLNLILTMLIETIDAERGTLYLVDEERGELYCRELCEDDDGAEVRVRIGEGIAGHVAATGEVLNISDAYADPRLSPGTERTIDARTATMLAAPVRVPHGKIIGVVQLSNKMGGPFTSRDERLLTAMAAQAAISIENARLYEQEMQQQLLNQELETARMIQQSFLPETVPQYDGWDIAAIWRPMQEVAGDFYDLYSLPDGRLAILIADVSGKGVPAALFMALSVTVLRFAMSLDFSPGDLMDCANQAILSDQQSKMFATVFAGYLDLDSGVLQFASAGHNPPLLFRAAAGRCEHLEASGVAMGLFREADFDENTVSLADGDVLVLYTDGITETFNTHEEEFGEDRLELLVTQHASSSTQELTERIISAVAAFAAKDGAVDDETLVVIKRVKNRR